MMMSLWTENLQPSFWNGSRSKTAELASSSLLLSRVACLTDNEGVSKKNSKRGRKDHYVPQGYLRGFIDPARASLDKPLWHYDLVSKDWTDKSPREVGWERGFYDYADTRWNIRM